MASEEFPSGELSWSGERGIESDGGWCLSQLSRFAQRGRGSLLDCDGHQRWGWPLVTAVEQVVAVAAPDGPDSFETSWRERLVRAPVSPWSSCWW